MSSLEDFRSPTAWTDLEGEVRVQSKPQSLNATPRSASESVPPSPSSSSIFPSLSGSSAPSSPSSHSLFSRDSYGSSGDTGPSSGSDIEHVLRGGYLKSGTTGVSLGSSLSLTGSSLGLELAHPFTQLSGTRSSDERYPDPTRSSKLQVYWKQQGRSIRKPEKTGIGENESRGGVYEGGPEQDEVDPSGEHDDEPESDPSSRAAHLSVTVPTTPGAFRQPPDFPWTDSRGNSTDLPAKPSSTDNMSVFGIGMHKIAPGPLLPTSDSGGYSAPSSPRTQGILAESSQPTMGPSSHYPSLVGGGGHPQAMGSTEGQSSRSTGRVPTRRRSTPALTSRQRASLPTIFSNLNSQISPSQHPQAPPLWGSRIYGPIGSGTSARRYSQISPHSTYVQGDPSIWTPLTSSPTGKVQTPAMSPAKHSQKHSLQDADPEEFSRMDDPRAGMKRSSSDGEILKLALPPSKSTKDPTRGSRSNSISSNESILSEGALPRSILGGTGLDSSLSALYSSVLGPVSQTGLSNRRSQSNPISRASTSPQLRPRNPPGVGGSQEPLPSRPRAGSDILVAQRREGRKKRTSLPTLPSSGSLIPTSPNRRVASRPVAYFHRGAPLPFPPDSRPPKGSQLQTHVENEEGSDSEPEHGSPQESQISSPQDSRRPSVETSAEFPYGFDDDGERQGGTEGDAPRDEQGSEGESADSSVPQVDKRRRPSFFGVASQALKSLNPLRAYYDISLSKLAALSPETRLDLYRETCPLCLGVGLPIMDEDGSATAVAPDDMACVVLRCKRLGCHHVAHALCFIGDPGRTLQRLQRSHPTSFVKTLPSTPISSIIASLDTGDSESERSRRLPGIRVGAIFEVLLLHMTSDTCIASWRCPSSPSASGSAIRAFVNGQNGMEYLYVDLTPEESARIPFHVARGRILFQCTSPSTSEFWRYQANYDLDFAQPQSPMFARQITGPVDLVLVDSTQGTTLTLTVVPLTPKSSKTEEKRQWAISAIRLEISSSIPAPAPPRTRSEYLPRSQGIVSPPSPSEVPAYVLASSGSRTSQYVPLQAPSTQQGHLVPELPVTSGDPYLYVRSDMQDPTRYHSSPRDLSQGYPRPLSPSDTGLASPPYPYDSAHFRSGVSPQSAHSPPYEMAQSDVPTPSRMPRSRTWVAPAMKSVPKDQAEAQPEGPISPPSDYGVSLSSLGPEDSKESIAELARSQVGSRYLQRRISDGDPLYFNMVFTAVYPHLPELMVDLFGNYLCQRLIDYASEEQRYNMLTMVAPHVVPIACDRQGTRAFQKMVELARSDRERRVVIQSLSGTAPVKNKKSKSGLGLAGGSQKFSIEKQTASQSKLLQLIRDPNGSHVIHAILDHFPMEMLSSIFEVAFKSARQLGVDQHGLCVLKKCMSLADPETFVRFSVKLLEHVLDFVNNQYGNYLIQHVIERANGYGSSSNIMSPNQSSKGQTLPAEPEPLEPKIRQLYEQCNQQLHKGLKGHYPRLSQQKFSSNVVEKCLRVGDPALRSAIISELMEEGTISSLLQDSFGNYVMQNVLYVANDEQKRLLIQRIQPDLHSLRKNIRKKWERLLSSSLSSLSPMSPPGMHPFSPPSGYPDEPSRRYPLGMSHPKPEKISPSHGKSLLSNPLQRPNSGGESSSPRGSPPGGDDRASHSDGEKDSKQLSRNKNKKTKHGSSRGSGAHGGNRGRGGGLRTHQGGHLPGGFARPSHLEASSGSYMPLPVPLPLPLPLPLQPFHPSQQRLHPIQQVPTYSRYGTSPPAPRKEDQIHADPEGSPSMMTRGWGSQPISPVAGSLQPSSSPSRSSRENNRFAMPTTGTGSRSAPVSPSAATTGVQNTGPAISPYARGGGGMYGSYAMPAPMRNLPHARPPFQPSYGQY